MSEDTLMYSGKGATAKLDVILVSNDSCLYAEHLFGPPRETSLSRKKNELQSHFQVQMTNIL